MTKHPLPADHPWQNKEPGIAYRVIWAAAPAWFVPVVLLVTAVGCLLTAWL